MTDREYDLWKAVFMSEYSKCKAENAALLADFAVEELRKRMAQPEEEKVTGETDPLKLYDWLTEDEEGDYIDTRTEGIVVLKSCEFPGKWKSWAEPKTPASRYTLSDSVAEAFRHVDWAKWDQDVVE